MIAASSFIRVSQALKVSNATSVCSKHINCFQGCCFLTFASAQRVTRWESGLNEMDRNKRKNSKTSIWRPVNLSSCSIEGSLVKEANLHSGVLHVRAQLDLDADVGGQGDNHEASCAAGDLRQATETHSEISEPVALSSTLLTNDIAAADLEKSTLPQKISMTYYPRKSMSPGSVSQGKIKEEISNDLGTELSDNPATGGLQHSTSIEVDASLVRFVKGKGGITQKKIEMETGVRLIFPSSKEDVEITVQGASVENVTRALESIKNLLDEAVKSPRFDYSHFVSLPLAIYPTLADKLLNFQNSILGVPTCQPDENIGNDQNEEVSEEEEDKNCTLEEGSPVSVNLKVEDTIHATKPLSGLHDLRIDQSIFIKPKTFHLTVLMLKLWNKERVATAVEVLQKVSSNVWDALEGRPISIRLKGVACMKGSPSKAGVLYAPVEVIDGEDRLLRACQVIIDAYIEAGLVIGKDNKNLKLHATVMNVRHRKGKKKRKYDSFDARPIIKQYGSEDWGKYMIREAHLSQRFMYDDDGYYHRCASITFPELVEDEAMLMDLAES